MPHFAKLSLVLAGAIMSARAVDAETHKAVTSRVFTKTKNDLGIPDKHKLRVELDDAGSPDYLVLIRKKNGTKYTLGADGRWNEAAGSTPAAAVDQRVWFQVPDTKGVLKDHVMSNWSSFDEDIQVPQSTASDLDALVVGRVNSDYYFSVNSGTAFFKLDPSDF